MTPEEVADLWVAFKNDPTNIPLRNQLVELYYPLLKHQAIMIKRRLPEQVELDNLVSAGVFGLMDAIDAFDLSRGVKFKTYCIQRMRGAMLDEMREMDWVPRLVRTHAKKLTRAIEKLTTLLGRKPTESEVMSELRITRRELEKMMLDVEVAVVKSLDEEYIENTSHAGAKYQSRVIRVPDYHTKEPQESARREDWLLTATRGLDRTDRLIVVLYYYSGLTMRSIGALLGLSESRVSQMHGAIITRLRSKYSVLQELPCR